MYTYWTLYTINYLVIYRGEGVARWKPENIPSFSFFFGCYMISSINGEKTDGQQPIFGVKMVRVRGDM